MISLQESVENIDTLPILTWRAKLSTHQNGPAYMHFSPEEARDFVDTFIALSNLDSESELPGIPLEDADILEEARDDRRSKGFPIEAYNALHPLGNEERQQVRHDVNRVLSSAPTRLPVEVFLHTIEIATQNQQKPKYLHENERATLISGKINCYPHWRSTSEIAFDSSVYQLYLDLLLIIQRTDLARLFRKAIEDFTSARLPGHSTGSVIHSRFSRTN